MDEERMEALVRRFYDRLWNAWDDDAVDSTLAEDFEFRASLGNATTGRNGWRAYRDMVRAGSPDFFNRITEIVCDGQRAAVRLECSGHHLGPLAGIEATGRLFSYQVAAFFKRSGDELSRVWALGDLADLQRQLTAASEPDAPRLADPTALYRLRDGVYAPDLLIVAVAELDLFSWLANRPPVDAQTIGAAFGLASRPLDVMLTYLVALGLLERYGATVVPTTLARDHLVDGSAGDLREYYSSLRERPGVAELRSVLTTGAPAAWASAGQGEDWSARLTDPDFAATITAAMDARGRYLAPHMAAALDDVPTSRVLDVAGSSGIYLSALLDRRPELRGSVLERSPVDAAARTLITARGYADRIEVATGDMFSDPWPGGHDLHLFSHVLHDWDEPRARALLTASYTALEPGGWVVDHDVHINADKTGPLPAAEYSVFLMHATPGKCWSVGELSGMLAECGFTDIAFRAGAAGRSLALAHKPR